MRTERASRFCAALLVTLGYAALAAVPAYSQAAPDSASQEAQETAHPPTPAHAGKTMAELTKEASNPVGSVIAAPFEWNGNMNIGPDSSRVQTEILIEPQAPFSISQDWNMMVRLIMPVVMQPVGDEVVGETHVGGFSDFNFSLYFTPKEPGALIWGAGPSFQFPTATEPLLGAGKWGAGPTVVVLAMPGKFVIGSLWSQIWSFAGDSERGAVSTLSWQYFVTYVLPKGWSLVSTPLITVDWKADSGNKWTLPVGGGLSYMAHLGPQLVSILAQAYWNVVRPDEAPGWQYQIVVVPLWFK